MTEARVAHAPAGLDATRLVRPRTTREACELLSKAAQKKERVTVLAGGTDFVVERHLMPVDRANVIDLVVDLTGIEHFHQIAPVSDASAADPDAGERWIRFGGGVTYWDLRASELVQRELPMLNAMAKDVGAVQIQTRGTLAGNVATASPAADGVAALLALDARLHLESESGTRNIALQQALLGYRKIALVPGEIIVAIDVRVPALGARVVWRKVGTRLAQAISKVALASVVETGQDGVIVRARFGMASVAATTHALPKTAKLVVGHTASSLDGALLDAAVSEDIQPIDDVRSTGRYRLHVAQALVRYAVGLE